MEVLKNGIRKYLHGNQTIWDMRTANTGRYKADSLNPEDVVVYSDRKAYRIRLDGSYRKLEKTELKAAIERIDIAIQKYEKSIPQIHK